MIAAGIAWWHGADGNYWGHNAIIRCTPLPQMRGSGIAGRKPFGGHILSHDFVEAALMRRQAGAFIWRRRSAAVTRNARHRYSISRPATAGGVREISSISRSCRHVDCIGSRFHLMTGIGSYLTAPLWLLFLMLGILISLQAQFVRPEYFSKGFSLFPKWPAQDPVLAAWVFGGTMGSDRPENFSLTCFSSLNATIAGHSVA